MVIFSKFFSSPVFGLDIGDQSVRYVRLETRSGGYSLRMHGTVPLSKKILEDGRIHDPQELTRVLAELRSDKNIRRVRTSLPESHLFIIENAGMIPVGSHTRADALKRALRHQEDSHVSMIVNFGEHQSDITIVSGKNAFLSRSFSLPGNPTANISDAFGINEKAARGVIHSIGLSREDRHEKVFEVLFPEATALAKAIDGMVIEWRRKHGSDPHIAISEILLAGSNAHMRGLREYLEASLRMPVAYGDPWTHFGNMQDIIPPISRTDASGYSAAIGLAMGE